MSLTEPFRLPAGQSAVRNFYLEARLRLRHAALLDFDHGVDAGLVRAQQLRELVALTPWMMFANIANALIISAFLLRGLDDWPLMLWGCSLVSIGLITGGKWWKTRKRPPQQSASRRAILSAIRHAGVLGALWAILPLMILPHGNVNEQVLTTNVIAGMSAGGAFALAAIPAAAGAYIIFMLLPCLFAIVLGYIPASAPLFFLGVIYFMTLGVTIFARYREFSHRIRDRFRIEKQNQTIGLLLKDFEASASDWLWETDAGGLLSHVSDRLAVVSGTEKSALMGQDLAVTAGDHRGASEWTSFTRLMQMGLPVRDLIVPAGSIVAPSWWSINAGPVRDKHGTLTGYRGVGTDITERKRAEIALAEQNQLLASFNAKLESEVVVRTREAQEAAVAAIEANKAKSSFLANMSHEIRTPMNGVFGMTDLLKRTPLTDHQERLVTTISQSAKSLLTIINDILDISRIEAGKLDIDRHEFDLRQCIEESVDLFVETAARKGINLTMLVDPSAPAVVWGDRGRLRQICINLLGNAIKFTQRGEVCIRVSLERTAGGTAYLAFEFKDTGIGIAPAMVDQLFTPFMQADSSISRRFGGTGLGLSISRYLVDLMGGDIRVESNIGQGTTLSFTLAFDVGDAGQTAMSSRRTLSILPANTHVLVVDDRAINREILDCYLKAAGAHVVAVSSGREGLEALGAHATSAQPFAAAVVDVVMPDMSGLEFLSKVREDQRFASLNVVLATSMSWAGDVGEVRRLGAHALLTKPIREADLITAVAATLVPQHSVAPAGGAVLTRCPINARVLVAEDNPVNIEVAKEYLASFGCQVRIAESGHQALAAFKSQGFDLILMDCQMPDMDGLEATRRIRALEQDLALPRMPIIAVTANAYKEDRERCLEAGMDDYLSKPFSEDDLAAALRRWAPRTLAA
jgi:signal transduction histidine kinase/CheY-like chemotaxis protein